MGRKNESFVEPEMLSLRKKGSGLRRKSSLGVNMNGRNRKTHNFVCVQDRS